MEKEQKTQGTRGAWRRLCAAVSEGFRLRRGDAEAAGRDCALFFIALVFARCHLFFGAYPLAQAFVAALPTSVPIAALGGAIGALTRGADGVVYALTLVILVILRAVISGTAHAAGEAAGRPFSENILLRMSSSVICGFILSVYVLLLEGVSLRSVAFSLTSILLSALLTLSFAGLFGAGIGLGEWIFGKTNYFTARGKGRRRYDLLYFQLSALSLCFFLSYSLAEYEPLGISFSYLLTAAATLFTAKRFGPLRAMAVGFVSCLGVSGLGAVAFALAGLGAGLLFPIGLWYGLLLGGGLLSLWGAYQNGAVGFLSLFPEYAVAALALFPLLRRLTAEKKPEEAASVTKSATDMVGTMALSYRARAEHGLCRMASTFSSLAPLIRRLGEEDCRPSLEEYRSLCVECSEVYCRTCSGYAVCLSQSHRPFADGADRLARKLSAGEKISVDDLGDSLGFCQQEGRILSSIRSSAAALEEERFKNRRTECVSDICDLVSKMLSEARRHEEEEQTMDAPLSERLSAVFCECGFADGVIRAFGKRRKYILAAGEDKDGTKITSPLLREALEEAVGGKLSAPEYFRREDMVLMECKTAPKYRVEYAVAAVAKENAEICGDSVKCFSEDDRFYAILSDGMGTGEAAHVTSSFSTEFLSRTADAGCTGDTSLHLLNQVIRERAEECSATVDLFSFDLLDGEARFYKSGAAPSYVKRGGSIFRIRSQTAPLGLLRRVDAERIRAEVSFDDYVILLSDGVSQSPEDAPWLLEFLNKPAGRDLRSYADTILASALKHNARRDDMSVVVLHILAA